MNGEQLTTVLFKDPKEILDAETAALFFNEDGSTPTGNIYFPHDPIVLKTNSWYARKVPAIFTTIEEIIQHPPAYLKSLLDGLLDIDEEWRAHMVITALYWYEEQNQDKPLYLFFTVFDDGTLVYNYIEEVEHE